MGIKGSIKEESSDIKNVLNMFKKRKFEGNTGQAVKNSSYHFATTFVGKLGSLLFTIIIARLLLPELFGLYGLALSTILLFASFSDFGMNSTLIRYVSKLSGKNNSKKAASYLRYIAVIKTWIILASSLSLAILAKFLASNYYHKPIFLALIAGSLYIIMTGFFAFVNSIFVAENKFRYPFYNEIIVQILRLILIPLTILVTIGFASQEKLLFFIIGALVLIYSLALLVSFILMKLKVSFIREKPAALSKKEKKDLWVFIIPLSATILSGIFFGYIDMIMLGRYVGAEYIGHYKAAFSLIGSLIPFIAFSNALFPIFSRLKGKSLERGLHKSILATILLSVLSLIGVLIFANLAINIIFGPEYSPAILILRILSVLLIATPVSLLYKSYLLSQGKTKTIAKLLILSTVVNIVLNYFLITHLIQYSSLAAVIGASIATIISRYLYLFLLVISKKN